MENQEPQVIIPLESYEKIMQYASMAEGEITGFADVDYKKEGNYFIVGEVYLIPQKAAGASVEMEEEDLSEFMLERIQAGATQLPRLWWHSHVNMQAFFSGTDEDTINNFKNDSWLIALVVNKKRELKCSVQMYDPFAFRIDDIDVIIDNGLNYTEEIEKEIAEKVKPMHVTYSDQSKRHKRQQLLEKLDSGDKKDNGFTPLSETLQGRRAFALASRNAHQLPKKLDEAIARIVEKDLKRMWFAEIADYAFIKDPENPQSEMWIDYWGVFDTMPYSQVNELIGKAKLGIRVTEQDMEDYLGEHREDLLTGKN